jgi:molecular chaperone HscB
MNPTQDHFQLFDLPRRFAVDMAALETRYRDLQREVHPDRFATAPATEQRRSMEMATRANEAYRVLKSPLSRARYLLELAGVDIAAEAGAAMPGEFLSQQMEWREALAEAAAAQDPRRLEMLLARVRADLDACLQDVAAALDGGATGVAAGLVRKLMFLDKLRAEIAGAQDRMEA